MSHSTESRSPSLSARARAGGLLALVCVTFGVHGVGHSEPLHAPPASSAPPAELGFAEPMPIQVPRQLARHTTLELSGIAWLPGLARYVVVSDDARDHERKHAPLLFTLSEQGRLDTQPIVIDGIGKLNDPESVTFGPAGTLFVCTSHSADKRGRVRASRTRLLQLAIGPERRAHVIGQVNLELARGLDGSAPWLEHERSTHARRHADRADALDIEAIAYRDGALYIGLKAPLGLDGSARILRLPNALHVLDSGVVPDGALSIWSEARFCVERETRRVCEGIADFAFLADGGLLVVANSPKGSPSDGGGSLWRLDAPTAAPRLLRRFPGVKPEGVALEPDGQAAVIVFDRGGAQPLWSRWRLGA